MFDCDARMPLSERLCPCAEVDKIKEERARLKSILQREASLQRKEVRSRDNTFGARGEMGVCHTSVTSGCPQLARLAELSEGVARAMARIDRTHSALKATTEELSKKEGRLAEMLEEDKLDEEVQAITAANVKVRLLRPDCFVCA